MSDEARAAYPVADTVVVAYEDLTNPTADLNSAVEKVKLEEL